MIIKLLRRYELFYGRCLVTVYYFIAVSARKAAATSNVHNDDANMFLKNSHCMIRLDGLHRLNFVEIVTAEISHYQQPTTCKYATRLWLVTSNFQQKKMKQRVSAIIFIAIMLNETTTIDIV